MRMGAIFARGSCRALKWMALFGVVFALGAGVASAQLSAPDVEVTEGNIANITVTVEVAVAEGASDGSFTVTAGPAAVGTDGTTHEATDLAVGEPVLTLETPQGPADDGDDETNLTTMATLTGTIRVQAVQGDDDAEDEELTISLVVAGVPTGVTSQVDENADATLDALADHAVTLTIKDDETQTYVLALDPDDQELEEGDLVTVSLTAVPAHEDNAKTFTLNLDRPAPDYSFTMANAANDAAITGSVVTIGAAGATPTAGITEATITVSTDDNDENRSDGDTVTLTAYSGQAGDSMLEASLPIMLKDVNTLPGVTAEFVDDDGDALDPQPTSLMEGVTYMVELTVVDDDGDAMAAAEDLEVSLMGTGSADMDDYVLSMNPVEIDATEMMATVDLTITSNEEVNMEALGFDAEVAGEDANGTETSPIMGLVPMLPIDDITTKLVFAKSEDEVYAVLESAKEAGMGDDGLNPGESFTIDMAALFGTVEGMDVTLAFDSESADPSVAAVSESGSMLTVTAGTTAGVEAMVTVTAAVTSSSMSPSSVNIPEQTRANVAQVQFPVMVENKPLMVDVSTDAMNGMVDEGGMLTVMAEANRAVLADEEAVVTLGVSGPVDMSEAMITIAAGATMGETMLQVDDDDMVQPMGDIVITATGDGITGAQTLTVSVTEDDMPTTYELTASADSVMEGGEVTITATASQMVAADTMIDLVLGAGSADGDDYSLDPMMISIAAGSDSGMAMLMATDDTMVEGDESLTLNGMVGNMVVGSVMLTITDNDEPEPVVPTVRAKDGAAMMIADAISTAAGGSEWMVGGMVATIDMSMLFDVDDGVTADFAGSSSDEMVVSTTTTGGTMLALTPMSAGMATITVTGTDRAGGGTDSVMHDAAVALQTLVLTVTIDSTAITEGDSATITVGANRAVTEDDDTTLMVTVTGDTAAVEADPMIAIATGEMTATGAVMAVEDDDSADAMVSVVVSGSAIGSPITFDVTISDNDPTVSAKSDAEVDAVFTVAVATASGMDGWVPTSQGGEAATLDMGDLFDTNGSPTLEYMAESSAEDMVAVSTSGSMLTLTPMAMGDATITVTATDTSGDMYDTATVMSSVMVGQAALVVTVSPETASVEEGESVEISAMLNRPAADNVEVMLIRDAASSASADDYSLAPSEMITVIAGDIVGKVTLTVENDLIEEGAESLTLVARVKDMGDVGTVVVSIMASDPASTFTLSGPMDTNLVEGQSYELTVTADPAVQVDTEVTIMRDGASSADDADFTVGSVMLSAGDATGTTMLMVTDDGMDDSGHGMPEMLTVYGMAGSGQSTNSLTFNIWDAAVPALPIIAQLLLAAFLAIGGYRRYLRR